MCLYLKKRQAAPQKQYKTLLFCPGKHEIAKFKKWARKHNAHYYTSLITFNPNSNYHYAIIQSNSKTEQANKRPTHRARNASRCSYKFNEQPANRKRRPGHSRCLYAHIRSGLKTFGSIEQCVLGCGENWVKQEVAVSNSANIHSYKSS